MVAGALTVDGSQMLLSGMTAQGYFTPDDRWVARNEMVELDADGNLVESKPSTLGVPQHIEGPVDPQEVLALAVESVFFLEAGEGQASVGLVEKLKAGYLSNFNNSAFIPFSFSSLSVES